VYYNNKYLKGDVEKSIGFDTYKCDSHLINDLKNAVIKETNSYIFYQRLIESTKNTKYKRIISKIQQDELKHSKWFIKFIDKLNEKKPQVIEEEIQLEDFESGLKKAIQNKIETSLYYNNTANKAKNIKTFIYLIYLSHEEHRHKSCLEYILYDSKQAWSFI
jgi:rubrerythrin